MKPTLLALVAAFLVLVIGGYFLLMRVPSGTVTIATKGEPPTYQILEPGYHIAPFGARLASYPTGPVSTEGEAFVTTSNGGSIGFEYSLTARLDPARVAELAPAIKDRPLEAFLQAQVVALLQQQAGGTDPLELLSSDFRGRAREAIVGSMAAGGLAEASLQFSAPDSDSFLAAARYLAPRGEAWKLRLPVSEALLEPGRDADWKLLTAMGLVNESEKLLAEAEKNYLDALAVDPTALPPMSQIFTLYSTVGEWEKLQRVLDAALTVNPRSVQHLMWTAMVLIRRDDPVGAERMLDQALEVDPDNPLILSNLGVLYMKTERYDEAETTFRKAVDADPNNPAALYNLGTALAATDRFDEALPYLEEAEQKGRASGPLLDLLALVHDKLGHKARAREYRKQARELGERQEAAAPS